jgi:bifunctional non-homologous end joining protein LigD
VPRSATPSIARLDEYAHKRAFDTTPEPAPVARHARKGPLFFVVQQHAARRLHYDFRLELDGVLKSWAIPKGPAIVPGEKHLAVMTEDHPFDYGSFEGIIPPRQYGAGSVIIWDCGVYAPDAEHTMGFHRRAEAERRMRADLDKGKLSFFLLGRKLKGSFALVRTSDRKNWLLIKHNDRYNDVVAAAAGSDRSALCGRTVEEMAGIPSPVRLPAERLGPHGPAEPLPRKLLPMLATQTGKPVSGADWMFEPKLDGYRVIAICDTDTVKLQSRSGLNLSRQFPEIVRELRASAIAPMVLDGELIALGEHGKPSFNALQNRAQLKNENEIERAAAAVTCIFVCFDLLHFAGISLRNAPYQDRVRYLDQCLLRAPRIQRIESSADGQALYRAAIDAGFEGTVAKRKTSLYRPGTRSREWIKVKAAQSAEFFIGGYAEGKGSRADRFGALLVGLPTRNRKLKYAGRVGTGFDERLLAELRKRFDTLATRASPFTHQPPIERPTTWLKPKLVAEIRFAERTPDGLLRAPVFLRLRDDVKPQSPGRTRSRPAPNPVSPASAALEALRSKADSAVVTIEGERISLTHLNKVLWPADKRAGLDACTKRDLLNYLLQVADYLLPHAQDRPLTLIRMPEGIHGQRFFQKHWDQALPRFVQTVTVFSESNGRNQRYLLCNNLPTLVWLGQLGALELHVWHSRANPSPDAEGANTDYRDSAKNMERSILNCPDYIVFDIDPYIYSGKEAKGAEPEFNRRAFEKGKEVAFHLKEVLDTLLLRSMVKTSGKTGIHVFVPIVRTLDFGAARRVSETIGRHLLRKHPKDITMEWSVEKRTGKIFIDHNMNVRGKTLNVAYSPRGVAGAPVSMPLTWKELETAQPHDFRIDNAVEFLRRRGDAWRDALELKQSIEAVLR